METGSARGSLLKRAFAGLLWCDREVACSPLGRWAYLAFVLGAPFIGLVYRATESLRYYLAVVVIYGRVGYERDGIRFLNVRHPRYSNGVAVSWDVQCFVGIVPLIVGVLGTIYVTYALKCAYESWRGRTPPPTSPR